MEPIDQIVESLREWYNEVVQDDGPITKEQMIIVLCLWDDLDNRLIAGHPLPKEWRR